MDNPQDDLAVLLIGPGAAPLPKIDEEAVALLTACNSLLNSFALQGAPINRSLLTDLTVFCRNAKGFGVPFDQVAKRAYPSDHGIDMCQHLDQLGLALAAEGDYASHKVADVTMGAAHDMDRAAALLTSLATMELLRERICGYMGWSRILINARARMLVDEQEASKLKSGKGKPH